MQSGIGSRKLLILTGTFIFKIVRAAEIILGTGSYDSGIILIAIHEKLNFAFAPPAVIIETSTQIGTYIMSFTFNSINNGMQRAHIGLAAAILCMEVSLILAYLSQCIGNLII